MIFDDEQLKAVKVRCTKGKTNKWQAKRSFLARSWSDIPDLLDTLAFWKGRAEGLEKTASRWRSPSDHFKCNLPY